MEGRPNPVAKQNAWLRSPEAPETESLPHRDQYTRPFASKHDPVEPSLAAQTRVQQEQRWREQQEADSRRFTALGRALGGGGGSPVGRVRC